MVRKVIVVNDYSVTPDDPNDWISVQPGGSMELVIVSHYHHYRVGMEGAGSSEVVVGDDDENAFWQPEGDNADGSKLTIKEFKALDERTFSCVINAESAKEGDNFIVYLETHTKAYRSPIWPHNSVRSTARRFQIHVHVGESIEEYVEKLQAS